MPTEVESSTLPFRQLIQSVQLVFWNDSTHTSRKRRCRANVAIHLRFQQHRGTTLGFPTLGTAMASTLSGRPFGLRKPFPDGASVSCSTLEAIRREPVQLLPGGDHPADQLDSEIDVVTRLLEAPTPDQVEVPSADPELASDLDEAMARFPTVGRDFLGFHLLHELGRGGFGRVFLCSNWNSPIASSR